MAKVLLIDDDKVMLDLYTMTLTTANHTVVATNAGHEGIAKAKTEQPDLILLDMMMPEMNGIEALEVLKKDATTKNIPVVILSNLADDYYVAAATEKGAAKYLVKSDYDPDQFLKEIDPLLKK